MKTLKKLLLLSITLLFLCNITIHSQDNTMKMISNTKRTKYQKQNKTWNDWNLHNCNVLIYFEPENNTITTNNGTLNQKTAKIFYLKTKKYTINKSNTIINWYTSEDSRGKKLFIAFFIYPDKQYKISFIYDTYIYDYICVLKKLKLTKT